MDKPEDIEEIRALCEERHPHSSEETLAWLAVHRLLREIDKLELERFPVVLTDA